MPIPECCEKMNLREDDLFLNFDADEIPKREVVTFLKLHSGYGDIQEFGMRYSKFGYFHTWTKDDGSEELWRVAAGCTIKDFREFCQTNPINIRQMGCGESMTKFKIGVVGNYAGHHCTWCYSASYIVQKLYKKVPDGDMAHLLKHGSISELTDLNFVQGLIDEGKWFDGRQFLKTTEEGQPDFAPEYVLAHREKYAQLLLKHPTEKNAKQKLQGIS